MTATASPRSSGARSPGLLALLLVAGCAAAAPAPRPVGAASSASPEDRLVAAIETEGCVFSRQTSGAILLRANLTSAQAQQLIIGLGQQGRVEASGADGSEAIRILSENCI